MAYEIVKSNASKLLSQIYDGVLAYDLTENMDSFKTESEHPKKRRRRLSQRMPVSARLVGDEDLRGITGVASDDLWMKIFGSIKGTLAGHLNWGTRACY